jgi:Fic/DOC family
LWTPGRKVDMASAEKITPEVVFSDKSNRFALSKAVSRGTLRRISRGVYTRSLDDLANVVRRNLWAIVGHEFPGAVISDRCARRPGPDETGVLTVVHARTRPVDLPGLRIVPRPGAGPLAGDISLPFGLWSASTERGMLDNLAGTGDRFMEDESLEGWIVDLAAGPNGARRLNDIRDRARRLAPALSRERAMGRLDALISAALATGPAAIARSQALQAYAAGAPYDRTRVDRFAALVAVLADLAPEPLPAFSADAARRTLLPFYEAYFSNYIEGTEFSVDEAADIVFGADIPESRPKDAHDILGTYRLVSDEDEMSRTPRTGDELIALLLERHGVMLDARPEVGPGRFKNRANKAGTTQFVTPQLVEATLRAGFETGRSLVDPFARALFMMFLVAEVHPFTDGNGRMARVMMNAELASAAQVRIIIPTVYRLNYLAALKGATHNDQFMPLVATLRFAQRYTARVDFTDRVTADRDLASTNALRDPQEAEDYGVRLVLPSAR